MKTRKPFSFLVISVSFCLWACLTENNKQAGRGTVVENEIAGVLIPSEGKSVRGARISLYSADSLSSAVEPIRIDTSLSTVSGEFDFKGMPAGAYSIIAQGIDGIAFIDSILVSKGKVQVKDTLRSGATVLGTVTLRSGDNPHSVRIQVLGSGFISQADSTGNFGMTGMPDGRLRVRLSTTLPGYKVLETKLELVAGQPISVGVLRLPDL